MDVMGPGESCAVEVKFDLRGHSTQDAIISVTVGSETVDAIIDVNTRDDRVVLPASSTQTVVLRFHALDLSPGSYSVSVGLYSDWNFAYDYHHAAYGFQVAGGTHSKGVYKPARDWRIA